MSWTLFHREKKEEEEQEIRRIGPYEILAKIGRGSSGSVYKARHLGNGLVVALKWLCVDAAQDPVSLKRFEQEFLVLRSLQHPHIVRGLDFGYHETLPYLVLEFVEGGSLTAHLDNIERMNEVGALQITAQIAHALQFAHQRGLIHRDVHPGNILMSSNGQAMLTDFGLVKSLESCLNLTATATTLGTPCYMAPEQFYDAKRIDKRSDVYALAATLYKTITGQSPYNSKAYGTTVIKKLNGELIPPRELVPDLTLRVDWAILRALSISPVMRPASCEEFMADLTGSESPLLVTEDYLDPRGAERRSVVRYPCRLESLCWGLDGKGKKSWEGVIQNISSKGLGLVIGQRFERGTVLELAFQENLVEVMGSMIARVVRAEALGPDLWFLGCQLERKICDQDLDKLLSLDDRLGNSYPERG